MEIYQIAKHLPAGKFTDEEMCIRDRAYVDGEVQLTYMIPVRIMRKQEDGTHKMRTDAPDFFFPFSRKYFGAYTNEAITLKAYMGEYAEKQEIQIKNRKKVFLALVNLQ